MTTDKLCKILEALGGNPADLPNMLEETIVDAIIVKLGTAKASTKAPTSAEVVSAIDSMTASQVTKVKKKLGISATN